MAGYLVDDDTSGIIPEGEDDSDDGGDGFLPIPEVEDDSDEDYEEEDVRYNITEAPRTRVSLARTSTSDAAVNQVSKRILADTNDNSQRDDDSGSEVDFSKIEIDGLYCPICMEPWTNGGDHQVCCLPCGHLFGISCIKKWLQQCRPGKCPQCKRKCTLKNLRVIFASQIVAVDQKLEKKIRSLEAKCATFEMETSSWHKKEGEWKKREADWQKKETDWQKKEADWKKSEASLLLQIRQNTERTHAVSNLSVNRQIKPTRLYASNRGPGQDMLGHKLEFGSSFQGHSDSFLQQQEFQVDDAKLYDLDVSQQIVIFAQRLTGMGGMHTLTKMSLIAPHERETIQLPCNTKAVKDLHFSPHERLALVASLGKKLSVISMESNTVAVSYDLPAAAWSCSWDINSPNYAYAGLQNGMLLMFDMRQTSTPVESRNGVTSNPIHTVHSLVQDSGLPSSSRSVLTASSVGLCHWNFGDTSDRILVPGSGHQGICISCAYSPISNDIITSFRPKADMSGDPSVSQFSPTPAGTPGGQVVWGCHILYRRTSNSCYERLGSSSACVSSVRLPKTAVINRKNDVVQFACGDDVSSDLVLQELPSYRIAQRLGCPKYPVRDVKYTPSPGLGSGFLSCLSDDVFQLFSAKLF